MRQLSFLQSVEWEAFQKSVGRKTWRIRENLVVQHTLPMGLHYLYCPRPLSLPEHFFAAAAAVGAQERSLFLKVDPQEEVSQDVIPLQPSSPLQPQETVIIDLGIPEGDLLREMDEKKRYNIRIAERRGVTVVSSREFYQDRFETFWNLLQETASRDGFHTHTREHYQKLLAVRSADFSNELFFARYQGRDAAALMINFFRPSGMVTYLHGASSRAHKEVMAPHLLHWRVMQESKKRGFAHYDLWGIDKKWPGMTHFKKGFGGRVVAYPRSINVVYRPLWYRMYRLAKMR